MDTLPRNAKYSTHAIHEEIVEIQAGLIKAAVVRNIREFAQGMFAIIADETADVRGVEQLALCLRYVEAELGPPAIFERFLGYVPLLKGMTGEALADAIQGAIHSLGLDMRRCVGQTYDGAASMSAKEKGVKARILREHPMAIFTHCCSHVFNLGANDAINKDVGFAISAANKVGVWFCNSPKRLAQLNAMADSLGLKEGPKKLLLRFCNTRFAQRFECVLRLRECLQAVILALDDFANEGDSETRVAAQGLLGIMRRFDVIFSVFMLAFVAPDLILVTKSLQGRNVDLIQATQLVGVQADRLSKLATNHEAFKSIYADAESTAIAMGCDIELPRGMRARKPKDVRLRDWVEDHIWAEYLQGFATFLKNRFSDHQAVAFSSQRLLPSVVLSSNLAEAIIFYESIHGRSRESVGAEVRLWQQRWANEDEVGGTLPSSLVAAIPFANKDFFPAIRCTLLALLTLPATSCEAERSFSCLKRIKTPLRSSLGQDRLEAAAHLSMNRDIPFSHAEVIRIFEEKKDRRAL